MQSSLIAPIAAVEQGADLVQAIRSVGVRTGDIVYVQVCTEGLGDLGKSVSPEQLGELIYASFREVVGPEGTILAPAFTFSFCRQELFDVERTPTVSGLWNTCTQVPELIRRLPGPCGRETPSSLPRALGRRQPTCS